jgi:hypothetical protein
MVHVLRVGQRLHTQAGIRNATATRAVTPLQVHTYDRDRDSDVTARVIQLRGAADARALAADLEYPNLTHWQPTNDSGCDTVTASASLSALAADDVSGGVLLGRTGGLGWEVQLERRGMLANDPQRH